MSDSALWAGLQRGDPDALGTIYRLYKPPVVRLLHREMRRWGFGGQSGVATDLEDLLQEVFIRAFGPSARRSYDTTRDYQPFLAAIARNVATDHFRARRRQLRLLHWVARNESAAERAQASPRARSAETVDVFALERLHRVISQLPPSQKELLRVRFYEDTSQRAAATAMGFSYQEIRTMESTVRQRLRCALHRPVTRQGDGATSRPDHRA
jgi:RNA polymerase sigma-70 factor (ECF subfamily)